MADTKTIVRRTHTRDFVVVPNAIAEDDEISLDARGLLLYLLAKPNDWEVHVSDIRKRCKIGRDKAYKLLRELTARGYARRSVMRVSGQYNRHVIEIYDYPMKAELPLFEGATNSPFPDLPDTAKPEAEKPDTANQHTNKGPTSISTHSNKTPTPKKGVRLKSIDSIEKEFETLWDEWAKAGVDLPDHKQAAFNRFMSHGADYQEIALKYGKAYRDRKRRAGLKAFLMTWLEGEVLADYTGEPLLNENGEFLLKPEDDEYKAWLDYHRRGPEDVSRAMVEGMAQERPIAFKDRKPPAIDEKKHPLRWEPVKAFSEKWMLARFSVLFDGPERERPKSTAMIEASIKAGNEAVLREQMIKHCWPSVKYLDERSQMGRGFAMPLKFALRDDLGTVGYTEIDSPECKAMYKWIEDRGWPPLIIPPTESKICAIVPPLALEEAANG